MPPELPALMTAAQIAETFQVSVSTIYRWADDHVLTPIRVQGTVRFRRSEVEDLLSGERTG